MFTLNQLHQIMPSAGERAGKYYAPLHHSMRYYQIHTVYRAAAFLATIAHESGQLRYTREIWGPTAAQLRYEGRTDLGNTQPGDGRKYMGRGFIQITGRFNYERISSALGIDFVTYPELLEQPEYCSLSACWWWSRNGCNALADAPDFAAVTRRVNGGMNGWADRLQFYDRAMRVLAKPDFSNVESGASTYYEGS